MFERLLIILLSFLLLTPKTNFGQLISKSFKSGAITNIAQDSLGALLIGTESGLKYFDGEKFFPENYEPIRNSLITAIYVDSDSTIYVAVKNGFAILPLDGKNKFIELDGKIIYSFYENINRILLTTSKGIFEYANGKVKYADGFEALKDIYVYDIIINAGYYYVASEKGLYIYSLSEKNWKLKLDAETFGLDLGNNGNIWVSSENGLFIVNGFKLKSISPNLTSYSIFDIGKFNKKIGKYIFPGNTVLYLLTASGGMEKYILLKDELIGTSFVDAYGGFWGKNLSGDLTQIFSFDLLYYERHFGVKSVPFGFIELNSGEKVVATDGQGILKYSNGKFDKLYANSPSTVWRIYQDSKDRLWATSIDGILYFDKNGRKNFVLDENKEKIPYASTIIEVGNKIWIAGIGKIYSYENGETKNWALPGFEKEMVTGIVHITKNKFWVVGSLGLKKFDSGKFVPFSKDTLFTKLKFYDVETDDKKRLILASYDDGVWIYDPNVKGDKNVLQISQKNGLINDNVYDVFLDKKLRLWVLTANGLSIIDYKKLISNNEIDIVNFGEGDPVLGDEYNQYSGLEDSNGEIWLGNISGIVRIKHPDKLLKKDRMLIPYFHSIKIPTPNNPEKVFSSQRPGFPFPKIELNYFENTILIEYGAISFTNHKLISYKYVLSSEATVTKPSLWLNAEKAYLFALSPNSYEISLEAKDCYGKQIKNSIPVKISIAAPFWKTKPFYFALLLFVLLFVVGLVYLKERSLKKRNDELLETIREKEALAAELKKTSAEYQDLFENAFNPMIIFNVESLKIIDANNAAAILFGYTTNEFKKIKFKDIFLFTREDLDKHLRKFRKTKTSYYHFYAKMRNREKKKFEVEVNAKVIKYKGKDAAILVIKDITKERKTEENLRRSRETLEKTKEMQSNFLAQISHEIRTPLNSITSFVNLIYVQLDEIKDEALREDFAYAMGSIVSSSKRIIRTVELLLNKSQLDTGVYVPTYEQMDMIDLLNNVKNDFADIIQYKKIDLNFEHDEEKILFKGDYYGLSQIFLNIVDNAVKYTKEGFVTIKVWTNEDEIIVEVIDTGIGIKKEYIPYLFDAFSQEDNGYTRKFDGSGLGLSVVKHFCDILNCKIEVESEKGKGATFRVRIKRIPTK